MKKIILHWTAGGHTPNAVDLKAYHFVVGGKGEVVKGVFPPEANLKPVSGKYAAHCLNCNTGSIGVSLAAMAGATEYPFNAGKYPVTQSQIDSLVVFVASLCDKYGIPVTPETVLTHAEVQKNLGITQKNKWDITYIPELGKTSAKVVGDFLRQKIKEKRAK